MPHRAFGSLRIVFVAQFLLLGGCLVSGCAQIQHETHLQMEAQLRAQRAEAALYTLEQQHPVAKSSALYYLNKAMILRLLGEYEESIANFEQAKNVIGRLSATSITETVTAYTVSEQFNSYQATNYERLFVHIYQILNFMALGKLEEARVEALQIDVALNRLTEVGCFAEAAAARYIAGLVFEASNEPDNALIAYQRAFDNYMQGYSRAPRDLHQRIRYLSAKLGVEPNVPLNPETEPSTPASAKQGQIVIFSDIDFAPEMVETNTSVINPETGHWIRISLPRYRSRYLDGVRLQFNVKQKTFATDTMADIEMMAFDELEREMPALTRRAIARTISKVAMTERADEESEILGHLVNFVGAVLEQADTRNWLTLPNKILLSSESLEQGTYTLEAVVLDQHDRELASRQIDNVVIEANQITFLHFSWHDNHHRFH